MATNKTRCFFYDISATVNPQAGFQAVCEFDVYQEAIDYARAAVFQPGASTVQANVYSYDNPSFEIFRSGGSIIMNEIIFPRP